jgi:hypothetical protein
MSGALFCIRCGRRLDPDGNVWCRRCAREREEATRRAWAAYREAPPTGWETDDAPDPDPREDAWSMAERLQRGQAIVELALALPLLLAVLVGFADVALLSWRTLGWQQAVGTVAVVPSSADAEMTRTGCRDGVVVISEEEGVRTVAMTCAYFGPARLLDGDKTVTASAPLPEETPLPEGTP